MYSYGSPHTAAPKQDDQHERTFSSYVRIQVVVLKTCLGRWTIGMNGERGSGISLLPAWYDDDDDRTITFIFKFFNPLFSRVYLSIRNLWRSYKWQTGIYIYIYIYIYIFKERERERERERDRNCFPFDVNKLFAHMCFYC